jgi:cysteinyl-tRNA synthetase
MISKIATLKEGTDVDDAAFAELKRGFTDALDNDLNTSLAITAVYNVLKAKCSDATKLALLSDFDRVLSLNLLEAAAQMRAAAEAEAAAEHAGDPEAEEIEALIAARATAKKEKNFAEADRIRAELTSRGITLIDTAQGTKWQRN